MAFLVDALRSRVNRRTNPRTSPQVSQAYWKEMNGPFDHALDDAQIECDGDITGLRRELLRYEYIDRNRPGGTELRIERDGKGRCVGLRKRYFLGHGELGHASIEADTRALQATLYYSPSLKVRIPYYIESPKGKNPGARIVFQITYASGDSVLTYSMQHDGVLVSAGIENGKKLKPTTYTQSLGDINGIDIPLVMEENDKGEKEVTHLLRVLSRTVPYSDNDLLLEGGGMGLLDFSSFQADQDIVRIGTAWTQDSLDQVWPERVNMLRKIVADSDPVAVLKQLVAVPDPFHQLGISVFGQVLKEY